MFLSISVVTTFIVKFFHALLIYFCVLYLFLWHFSLYLYSYFTFWHCNVNSILHKQVLYNALAYLFANYFIFNYTHRPYN